MFPIVFVSQTYALVKRMFFVYHISIIEIEKLEKRIEELEGKKKDETEDIDG